MKTTMRAMLLAAAATITIGVNVRGAALAQDAAMKAPVDCANASSMMMKGDTMMSAPKASGDVDRDFAHAMAQHTEAMMSMVKMEIACGKDAKTKDLAKKLLQQQREELDEIRLLVGAAG